LIELTKEEIWASNILNGQINNAQAELQRVAAARNAFIKLLEIKYNAVFDPKSNKLVEKSKQKPASPQGG